MIKMSLLENGTDSFKSAYDIMEKLPQLQEGLAHNLKDAVLALNHGIEILLKLILKEKEEYLIFSDIGKYMNAKEKMIEQGKDNVLDVAHLNTVTIHEAINRIKYLCNYPMPDELIISIKYLSKIRNQFMHYEINLSEEEMLELLVKLKVVYQLSVEFFKKYINSLEAAIDFSRYELTVEDYMDELGAIYGEMQYEEMRLERSFEEE
ncbi:hypothetical protein [Paenibacillus polymyxa]|uniref:hypothetical protein n=1 Tax=Paenibacillus polymyxa TaxID=1406 RepID=UPI000D843559|nr:hypothetical protein [Paenibacillus polymyxa]MDU8675344.1 hypothetical protein [Paenibacillus polymyxa]MDU8700251.1 hypothetical protein [Paenibacillus polymyxa]URJ54868.1 hypothetical protein MF623_004267 [Paenibacillus polymyxa]URJ66711.1 hypothetical protein MF620_001613 [Paenibacillus polymyxa]URJ69381.1 hypothetical protein MF624_004248 [Paenibacillus polymyxa]